MQFSAPVAWQEVEGKKTPIEVHYALEGKHYGYALGGYDHQLPVMIDPLLAATYLGGNGTELPINIAIHPKTGDVYIVGTTKNPGKGFTNSFPSTNRGYQTSKQSETSLFLARINSDLSQLLQTTYFDGISGTQSGDDGLIIHPDNGDIYLYGLDSYDIPGADGAALAKGEGYIARFTQDLSQLKQATYLYPGIRGTDYGSRTSPVPII